MKKTAKRVGLVGLCLICLVLVGAAAVPFWTHGPGETEAVVLSTAWAAPATPGPARESGGSLKVITLNTAHGRKQGWHQALEKRATIESNLDDIIEVLLREKPDVVALQEADGPSLWSGEFDHVQYLAEGARFAGFCRGEHVDGMNLSYGTALLSQLPMSASASHTFAPSPPTLSKGFVVATIHCPGEQGPDVDVVSVHLDFSRKTVRHRQVREMIAERSERENPLIVMGDFNCEWRGEDKPIRVLAEELDLVAYEPSAPDMQTFPKLEKRLDWILVSPELRFVEYKTIPDTLSDHRGVAAVLVVGNEGS